MKAATRSEPNAAGPPAATPDLVARLVPLEPGFYAFSLAGETGWREAGVGFTLPAIQVCAPPDREDAIEITDSDGGVGSWLGGRHRTLFVKAPTGGAAALVTAYPARDPDAAPLVLEIRRVGGGDWTMTLPIAAPERAPGPPLPASLHVIAHIRGRGDVRFIDSPWIGRLGPGMWIEAFMILSRNQQIAAAIEYKGLTADGEETAWLGCGELCGTRGRGLPLVGFAVRQRAVPGGLRVRLRVWRLFSVGSDGRPDPQRRALPLGPRQRPARRHAASHRAANIPAARA